MNVIRCGLWVKRPTTRSFSSIPTSDLAPRSLGFIFPADDSLGMDSQWHSRLEDAAISAGLEPPPGTLFGEHHVWFRSLLPNTR